MSGVTEAIVLASRTHAKVRVDLGLPAEFNEMRVQLVRATASRLHYDRDYGHLAAEVAAWERGGHLQFHTMPPPTHSAFERLGGSCAVGTYWFVNHADRHGFLSPGQVVDLGISLRAVQRDLQWPRGVLTGLMQTCNQAIQGSLTLYFSTMPRIDPDALSRLANAVGVGAVGYDPARPALH